MLTRIQTLIEAENELSEEPGSVVIDVVVPDLGAKSLSKIPLLVGGEHGFDIVSLDETNEGYPLLQTLRQQTRTVPSVRVYSDPSISGIVQKKFERMFPMADTPLHRDDEHDFLEY